MVIAQDRAPCYVRRAAARVQGRRRPALGQGKVTEVSLQRGLFDLALVSLLAALTPFVTALLSRFRVPQVVILIVGGVLIGPQVLGWADPDSIELVSNLGLGFLFLLAGYELGWDCFGSGRDGSLSVPG